MATWGDLKVPLELKQQTRNSFNYSYLDEISLEGLFLRSKIPSFQKALANNFVTIRRIFSYTVVQPKVTNAEYAILEDNGFYPLESTTEELMCRELMRLVDWANSYDGFLEDLSKKVFEIRVKELKYIFANISSARLVELGGGYRVLEKYLEFIAG